MNTWMQLRLFARPDDVDACAALLLECGCEGTQIDDTAVVLDNSEDATLQLKSEAIVTGYLAPQHSLDHVRGCVENALHEQLITARLEAVPVPEEDWSTSWRQNFPPLRIGPFSIVATWHEEPEQTDETVTIRLDPGLAFGTGQHPTTSLCLQLISERLNQFREGATSPRMSTSARAESTGESTHAAKEAEKQVPRVLDVGCGSGILSIAAAKLGAQVWAGDPDTFCVEATRDNAQLNEVTVHVVQAKGADWISSPFDVVVANLMSALLILLAPQLADATRPGGLLIVSGISAPRADEVEAALRQSGFQTLEKREQDGDHRGDFIERWTAFVLQKPLSA
jgi:ribosomal protein L11 methyltransferase